MKKGPSPAGEVGATRPQPAVRLALQVRALIIDNVLPPWFAAPWFATYTVWNAGSNAAACGAAPTSTLGNNPIAPKPRSAAEGAARLDVLMGSDFRRPVGGSCDRPSPGLRRRRRQQDHDGGQTSRSSDHLVLLHGCAYSELLHDRR